MSLTVAVTCPQLDLVYAAEPRPFDRLLAQALELFENCTSGGLLEVTSEMGSVLEASSKTMACELLSLICAPLVAHKAKSLLWSSLSQPSPSTALALYNAYKDDALVNLLVATFQPIRNSDLYDLENLQKCLLVCKSLVQQQRAHNLVKFLTDKFGSTDLFLIQLNALFWRVVNRCNDNGQFSPIGCPNVSNLVPLIETLVETMHAFLLVDPSNYRAIVDAYLRLLCSNSLDINFCTRKTLLGLLKQPKKSASSGTATTTVGGASSSGAVLSAATSSKSSNKQSKVGPTSENTASSALDASSTATLQAAQSSSTGERVDEPLRYNIKSTDSNLS